MNTMQALRVSPARRGIARFHDAIRRQDSFGDTGGSGSTISISVAEVKVFDAPDHRRRCRASEALVSHRAIGERRSSSS